jgi:ABC-2 type transport system permease protein
MVRFFREKANLFFVFIFPLLIIAVLGSQFGGEQTAEIGVVGSDEFTNRAIDTLTDSSVVDVLRVDDRDELADLVADGDLELGVVVAADAEEQLESGEQLQLTVMLGTGDSAGDDPAQLQGVVVRAFAAEAVVPGVSGQLATQGERSADEVTETVRTLSGVLPEIGVTRTVVGGGAPSDEPFGFSQVAVGMLLLMTFLNAFTAATALIQSRRLGVSRRMVATPTSTSTIVLGEGAGKWAIGMFQAIYIMIGSLVLFDVSWGNIPAAILVLVMFSAVAAGGAMIVGALMSNDEQAAGITVMVGLSLGALGGTMFPLELFGSTMTAVAHVTPHAWAVDAFTDLIRDDATLIDVLPEIGVLAVYALVLLGIASWRLRLTLTRVK